MGSRRLAADEARPFENLEALVQVDATLASALHWHAALITHASATQDNESASA